MDRRVASCSCSKLRVTTPLVPIRTSICHCFECQKRTGSAFGFQARFAKVDVEIEGASLMFTRKGDSGGEINFFFCQTCGSTVYWRLNSAPEYVIVAAGNFADLSFPAPVFSVYEDRCHHWVTVPEEIEHMA